MEQNRYRALDIMKFICALIVIIVHTSPLRPYSHLGNFILINVFGRFAVPFFFICAGYFVHVNTIKYGSFYFKKYIWALIRLYLIWSIVYLPFGIDWVRSNMDIPMYLMPAALLVGLFYSGTYFHLWYIPALLFSLIVVHWFSCRYHSYKVLLICGFLLLCLGAMETYYGVISNKFIIKVFDQYIKIFFTTRNGLFYGLFYVACGYYLVGSERLKRIGHYGLLTLLFFGLMVGEAFLLYDTNSLDFNFLIMAAPFTVYLFLFLKELPCHLQLPYRKLQEYTTLYYFTHAMFLVLIPAFLQLFHQEWLFSDGAFRFISVMICTHLLSAALYRYGVYKKSKKRLASY